MAPPPAIWGLLRDMFVSGKLNGICGRLKWESLVKLPPRCGLKTMEDAIDPIHVRP